MLLKIGDHERITQHALSMAPILFGQDLLGGCWQ